MGQLFGIFPVSIYMRLLFLSLLFVLTSVLKGQLSLRCTEVLPNGDVIIHWLPVSDPLNQFANYQVYYSLDGVIFTPLTAPTHITNRLATSYTHVGARADLARIYYKMVVEFNNGTSAYYPLPDSDTLSTMLIQLNNSSPIENGYAHLLWNSIHTPQLATTNNKYDIYRKYNLIDPWTLIGNTSYGSELFDDPDKICQDTPFYKVEIGDLSGCSSVSAIANDIIIDNKAPDAPTVDSVSVNPLTNEVNFSWTPDASIDLGGYIVVRDGAIIATLNGAALTTYTDINGNPDQSSLCYTIAATDNCLIIDPPAPPSYNTSPAIDRHCTIFLSAKAFNCEKRIELSWTKYTGWESLLAGYDIFVQENGGSWTMLVSLDASSLSYNHENVNSGNTYCYFIRAKNLAGPTSSSNMICIKTSTIKKPDALYITCLNVEDDEVYITFYVPKNSQATGYRILRSTRLDTAFTTVVDMQPSKKDTTFRWKDNGLGVDSMIYYYTIAALDSCDDPYYYSDTANTVLLQGTPHPHEFYNELYWNSYNGFQYANGDVLEYKLYVSYDGKSNYVEEKAMGKTQVYYIDPGIDEFLGTNGEFCYYIEAIEDSVQNVYGFAEKCKSNVACILYEDLIWIPNTFTPDRDKINDVFKPVLGFADAVGYEFIIYNRFGVPVFETHDKDAGWDGNKFDAPIGYYSYVVKYKNPYYLKNKNFVQDEFIYHRGSFLLAR